MVIEKAKRLVEHKRDVVILLDSITRLGRAFNTVVPGLGKSTRVDANVLQRPKRFPARRISKRRFPLTIIAALIDTGSRMDEVIFEELKGTGNSEIVLDRKVADKRVFPAMDILKSGTRKEELLVDSKDLQKTYLLRHPEPDGHDRCDRFLISKLKQTKSNSEFFDLMNARRRGGCGGHDLAEATPPGRGGVSVVRVSGPGAHGAGVPCRRGSRTAQGISAGVARR